jgi:hypothetical protein
MNGPGWGMGFGGPGMLLFWIIVIVAVVMLGKWLGSDSAGRGNRTGRLPLKFSRGVTPAARSAGKNSSRKSATCSTSSNWLKKEKTP